MIFKCFTNGVIIGLTRTLHDETMPKINFKNLKTNYNFQSSYFKIQHYCFFQTTSKEKKISIITGILLSTRNQTNIEINN